MHLNLLLLMYVNIFKSITDNCFWTKIILDLSDSALLNSEIINL